jgi:hypothetical protein
VAKDVTALISIMPSMPRLRIPDRSVYISPMLANMREVPARRVIARSDVNSAIMLLPWNDERRLSIDEWWISLSEA